MKREPKHLAYRSRRFLRMVTVEMFALLTTESAETGRIRSESISLCIVDRGGFMD